MKIIVSESQSKMLSELDVNDLDDLMEITDFLTSLTKQGKEKLIDFLELIKKSGLVNMMEAGQFLFMTKQHFDDMIRYKSHSRSFNEDKQEIIDQISQEIGMIRDIMIGAAVRYTELKEKELTTQNINSSLRKVLNSTLRFWIQGLLKKKKNN